MKDQKAESSKPPAHEGLWPGGQKAETSWIPACAGMTDKKRLVDTEEAARILGEEGWSTPRDQWEKEGISRPTFFRKLKDGAYEKKYILSSKGGGKNGQQLLVRPINESYRAEGIGHRAESIEQKAEGSRQAPPQRGICPGGKAEKDRYRVHRGEPGCHAITTLKDGLPVYTPGNNGIEEIKDKTEIQTGCHQGIGISDPTIRANRVCDPLLPEQGDGRECVASTVPTPANIEARENHPGDPLGQCAPATQRNLPVVSNLPTPLFSKEGANISVKASRIANLKFAFIQKINEELTKKDPNLPLFKNGNGKPLKTQKIQKLLDLYNSGILLPEIHKELGSRKRSTLYDWQQIYKQGGIDGLIPQYGGNGFSKITAAEKQFLRQKLLDQNRPTIGDTINKCKFLLGEESPSSPSTLRRWVNQFKKENYDLWVLEREGEKALNDKCVFYNEREWRDLSVGEVVVADGHKLNFQVVNPFTGKPTRAMMVLFWDWKSAYPLGWEIMLTESIQCVVSALRNAIITLGKFPTHALLDNGKAFRANIFRKEFRFQETEIPGIFDRLAIKPHFALPYNAQSKPIERFFRTFNDWFERELPSYSGASIPDKPAHMNRNEKRAKDLHDEWVPTISETMNLIFQWREYYIDQKLRARDYQSPRDIFEAEKGSGVDPYALHFLMMTCKAKMVHRRGITFNGWHWYHENLYGRKDYVLMFYSYYDLSQIYIFTLQNEFLCVAKPVERTKVFAADSEFPEDMTAVKQGQAMKKRAIRQTKALADTLRSNQNLQIDWNRKFRNDQAVVEAIEKIETVKKPKVVRISPFVDESQIAPSSPPSSSRGEGENGRPWFEDDYHKHDWLLKQDAITVEDRKFIRDFRSMSSLYKNMEFTDAEELDRKVIRQG